MPIDADQRRPRSRVGLVAVLGIFFLLFGFGSTSGSGNLLLEPWDKLVHMSVFAVLAIGLLATFPSRPVWLIVALALGIGMADELHQFFVPTRHPGLDDWLADAAGTFAGLPFWRFLMGRQQIRLQLQA